MDGSLFHASAPSTVRMCRLLCILRNKLKQALKRFPPRVVALSFIRRGEGRRAVQRKLPASPQHLSKISCMFNHREFFANKQVGGP